MNHTHTNRLAQETSPYLQQHQHNPVDWYAWGEDAFEAARDQNKPIFLSVGYSTCYWCHVMERQSFENEAIAEVMNRHFINIKVDREERPDVDQLYMTAVQVMTRQGGWPMSVWLLPDLRPFFGGTYFPPADADGRPGFPSILEGLAEAYATRRTEVEATAGQLVGVLAELAGPVPADEPLTLDLNWIAAMMSRSVSDYDGQRGGFGRAPKFPRQTLLAVLLEWIAYLRDHPQEGVDVDEFARPLRHTLNAMADGGIRDHLGGAFHRYSTDAQWLVPHFEIMLYDNAMLGGIYARASVLFDEPRFADVARGIFDFVLREMTSPEGAFYTAIDAEVDAREGLSYLWTLADLEQVLSPREASQFSLVYGLDKGPNFADPHAGEHAGDGAPTHNVLYLADPSREGDPLIAAMRGKLYQHRRTRKQPMLDTKIITSWNALMIRAMADAGRALGEPRYTAAATKAVDFLIARHRTPDSGLYRTSRDGKARHAAFLDDYAYLADALLALGRIDEAAEVATAIVINFSDPEHGGFFFTDADARDLVVRQKVGGDSPLPAGNAVATTVCQAVGRRDEAAAAIRAFAMQMNHHGESMSAQIGATLRYVVAHGPLHVEAGPPAAGDAPASPQDTAQAAVAIEPERVGEAHVTLTFTVAPGHHIAAESLALHAAADTLGEIDMPPAVRRAYPYADVEQLIHEGTFVVGVQLLKLPEKGRDVEFAVEFQVCTDNACLPAVRRTVVLTR